MNRELAHISMEIMGYVPLADIGFALPVYRAAGHGGNAHYTAIPSVEGDRQSGIADFEVYEHNIPETARYHRRVDASDPWIDVFIWNGQAYVGTAEELCAALHSDFDDILAASPTTLLDLLLASKAEDTAAVAATARKFLELALGSDRAPRIFGDVVVRPGVTTRIFRVLRNDVAIEEVPDALLNVGITPLPQNRYCVTFHLPIETWLKPGESVNSLQQEIDSFGMSIGILFEFEGLETDDKPDRPKIIPPPAASTGFEDPIQRAARSRLFGLAQELAIDLGSENTRIFARDRGVVLEVPSIVTVDCSSPKRPIIAVGEEAKMMVSRTPDHLEVVRPIRDGAIADIDIAGEMIKYFIGSVFKRRWKIRPLDVIICVPANSTPMERRALKNAAEKAGASRIFLIEAPMAAAIGAGMPVLEPIGSMVLNIGAGTTEIGILALRGLAYVTAVRVGGHQMDQAIVSYLRRHYNLMIGEATAEKIKKTYGIAVRPADGRGLSFAVRGRDLANAVPREITITQTDLYQAMAGTIDVIITAVRIALEGTAPELAADILEGGLTLTGGGALLDRIAERIETETGLFVTVSQDPITCVARGIGRVLEDAAFRNAVLLPN